MQTKVQCTEYRWFGGKIRVGHGLGPSMGWVGLGQSFLIFGGFGLVGQRLDCVIFLTL